MSFKPFMIVLVIAISFILVVLEQTRVQKQVVLSQISYAIVTNPNRQDKYYEMAEATWASAFPNRFWFTHKCDPHDKRFIQVPTNQQYARSSWEEMNALRFLAKKYPNSPWYMKSDDDVWLHGERLASALQNYDPREDWYLGVPLTFTSGAYVKDPLVYCAGGVGYIISNALMRKINSTLLSAFDSCCSDVQVGRLVKSKSSTKCNKLPGMFADSILRYLPIKKEQASEELRRAVGFHYVDPTMMALLDYNFGSSQH